MRGKRLLLCGQVFPAGQVGGLQLALQDLASALEGRGWDVDVAVKPADLSLPPDREDVRIRGLSHRRWGMFPKLRFLPDDVRTLLQHMLFDGGLARTYSDLLYALDARVRNGNYDAVIACVPRESPGLAHFITGAHPNVLILSLNGLAGELRRARWLAFPRLAGRLFGRAWIHPALYRSVHPDRIRMAVFPSESWRREAIQAGLPADACRTIYFGVRDVPPATPPRPSADRLLWVGRLSWEKGLHHFIEALPAIRRARPVTLTAVCGPGPEYYRQEVQRRIDALGLHEIVRLLPPVERDELPPLYRDHDALLFHSVFDEPVALVLAEAFACGLPVVASAPRGPSALLLPDETALCFPTTDPESISTCVVRMLNDESTRLRLRERARDLVRRRLSLDTMAAAYDDALRELLGSPAAGFLRSQRVAPVAAPNAGQRAPTA